MLSKEWMIYGANGYTGRLLVRLAKKRGLQPILAGRSQEVETLAKEHHFKSKIFSIDDVSHIANQIAGATLVVNCAGPFSKTAEKMMKACLKTSAHYIDITGEISIFELANKLDNEALNSNIVLCPGVGSDVIPTDCLAAYLKDKLPDATHLKMAWATKGSKSSKGTAKTAVEGMGKGGKIRENGKMKKVPLAYKTLDVDFGYGPQNTMTIPWADVYTAYHSTGISNIEFYFARPLRTIKKLQRFRWLFSLVRFKWINGLLKKRIDKTWKPSTDEERARSMSYFWGEVSNEKKEKAVARFTTADGYDVTAWGAIHVAEHLLTDHNQKGFYTPSILMGKEMIETMPGYSGIEFEKNN